KAIANILDPAQRIEPASVILLLTHPASGINMILDVLDAPPLPEPPLARVEAVPSEEAQADLPQSDVEQPRDLADVPEETEWGPVQRDIGASGEKDEPRPGESASQPAEEPRTSTGSV